MAGIRQKFWFGVLVPIERNVRLTKPLAAALSRCFCRRMANSAPCSSTARHNKLWFAAQRDKQLVEIRCAAWIETRDLHPVGNAHTPRDDAIRVPAQDCRPSNSQ